MLAVETRHAVHPTQVQGATTQDVRDHFLVDNLFAAGEIRLTYTHYDRFVMGGVVPDGKDLVLDVVPETKTATFLERREMGVMAVAGTGRVTVAAETYEMSRGDVLYIGMGAGAVTFSGDARFYLTSTPAHRTCPTRLIVMADAAKVELGDAATANVRTIYQFIHPDVMESCQLTMGRTELEVGSVWNTMPAHVHDRRMEAYLYIDVAPEDRVVHLMGEPDQTRNIFVANEEGVLSPPWSIHSGCGTRNYSFIWAMGGENMDFTDMDFVNTEDLR
ncbi:5-dehydro-4-deoxy-D-glucuronate isomerase [Litoreibacter albidus]|uniref:4-deoxy-L-threo-5-hexosulose-uronate ketol-isomerase n=1 Tax=Litoreibacter albidus TaxID=670155 RepID=A0A1H3CIL8_9RHOB|nr:5-dehydro-4-deoxy-D-glucuronate isomerase [Litoreibacter albidus]SDX54001.1 4-deoxy-L-threo-5-hexosulose-uronate ketol-isomerase [Litoreibacter albidus]